MVKALLDELTLEEVKKGEKVEVEFGKFRVSVCVRDNWLKVYLFDSEVNQYVDEKWYDETEAGLAYALKDLRAYSKENMDKVLKSNYDFHIMYSVGEGDEVTSIGCITKKIAYTTAQHLLDGLKANYNTIEYIKVIDKTGKLVFDLDVEQENVMVIDY